MKKKKTWLACVFFLISALAALTRGFNKRKKEPVYKFNFLLKDQKTGEKLLSTKEASEKIMALLNDAGCAGAEYLTYDLQEGAPSDRIDTLVFAVLLPPEKKAREVLTFVKEALNLSHAWYTREEYSYLELKKAIK